MTITDWFAGADGQSSPGATDSHDADRHYADPVSGEKHPLSQPRWRSNTGRPMLISPGKGITASMIDTSERGIWRYRAAFAVLEVTPITLGEGATPLITIEWSGIPTHMKLDWFAPTGSFKDRGAAVMLSTLREQGVTEVFEDSSGNGGASVAAYAAAGGLKATIFAPADASPAKLTQARVHGARIVEVPGPREASQQEAISEAERSGAFYASHNWQAFFLEGTKTLAYELWEDLGFRVPDSVIVPVGAGSLLLGLAIGFAELVRAGASDRVPRLFGAQPLNCSPVDAAFRGDLNREASPTVAEGTAIRQPLRLPEMLAALTVSGGETVAVTEQQIIDARDRLASAGLFVEPTSAVAAAAHQKLLNNRRIGPADTTVVVLTGTGLKSPA